MARSQPLRIAHRRRNLVIRQVCNRHGEVLDHLVERHDGSPEGVIDAAGRVSRRMFELYDDASNMASQIIASDEHGLPRWSISPNFRVITELDEVRTMAGHGAHPWPLAWLEE